MSISVVANRIYQRERMCAEDFQEMAPDDLLLRGCKPPTKTKTGLITSTAGASSDEDAAHPVRACVAFEVVKLPDEQNRTKGNPLNLAPGDVVACRNALVDPLPGNELATTNMYIGVLAVLERAPDHEVA